jgi:hypothetical protein
VVLSVDGVAEALGAAASLVADVVGSVVGEGVSADACPAIMITTMTDAATARLVPMAPRQRGNRRKFTTAPKMIPERVSCPEQRHDIGSGHGLWAC